MKHPPLSKVPTNLVPLQQLNGLELESQVVSCLMLGMVKLEIISI